MATINIKRYHNLGCEEARNRVDGVANSLSDKLYAECDWQGDRLNFNSIGASGTIDVTDDALEVNINLGLLLAPMKGSIEDSVERIIDTEFGENGDRSDS